MPRRIGALAPPLCVCCRHPLSRSPQGAALCPGCRGELARSSPVELAGDGLDAGYAALTYSGTGRRLVAALKFSRLLSVAELGAALIESRAPAELLTGTLVPVPPAPLRLARRGFDPAWELARALSGTSGLPLRGDVLRRTDLRRQRGGSRGRRLSRPPRISIAGPQPADVLLIDDVTTTGATLDVCAATLHAAGCVRVRAVVLAAVPRRPPLRQAMDGPRARA